MKLYISLSPAYAGALPEGEPIYSCRSDIDRQLCPFYPSLANCLSMDERLTSNATGRP